MKPNFLVKMVLISLFILNTTQLSYSDEIDDDGRFGGTAKWREERDKVVPSVEDLSDEDQEKIIAQIPTKEEEMPEDLSAERRLVITFGLASVFAGLSVLIWVRRKRTSHCSDRCVDE